MARLELPVMKTSTRAPAASASSAAYWMSGLSTIGSISFGLALVAGRKRVPRPATGNTANRTGAGRLTGSCVSGTCVSHDTGRAESRPAPGHRASARGLVGLELQICLVLVDELLAESLDLGKIIGTLERTV